MDKIVVAGIGVLSSIGNTPEAIRQSFIDKKTGIVELKSNDRKELSDNYPTGRIKIDNEVLNAQAYQHEMTGVTRTDALAKVAFDHAIEDAGITEETLKSSRVAFISASTVGGMDKIEELFHDATHLENPSEYVFSYSPSVHLHKIVRHYKMTGPSSVINTACSSSANAIMLGSKMLKANQVDIAIVGGVDCWSEFTFRGFNALGILSESLCQPFDEHRKGLNLGEGAAYLVLVREGNKELKKSYGMIAGWANINDSFHASSLNEDGSGIMKCIQIALDSAGIKTDEIGFINTHGTGTGNNDLAESMAISKLFQPGILYYSSKSYTGHTLGAAGVLEAIFSLIGLQNNEVYPSLNINDPLIINNNYQANRGLAAKTSEYALSNSFGFNGNCTSLILQRS